MLPDIWGDNCAAFCEGWGVSWERWDREPQPWSLPASKTVRDHKRPQRVIFHLKNKGVIFKSKISQLFQNSSQQKAPCAPKQQEQPTGAAQPKELLSRRHTCNSCGTWALPSAGHIRGWETFTSPGPLCPDNPGQVQHQIQQRGGVVACDGAIRHFSRPPHT